MTRVTQLIHDVGKYLLISVYPLPTHPTHNFTHNNGGNLDTLLGLPRPISTQGTLVPYNEMKNFFWPVSQKTLAQNVWCTIASNFS